MLNLSPVEWLKKRPIIIRCIGGAVMPIMVMARSWPKMIQIPTPDYCNGTEYKTLCRKWAADQVDGYKLLGLYAIYASIYAVVWALICQYIAAQNQTDMLLLSIAAYSLSIMIGLSIQFIALASQLLTQLWHSATWLRSYMDNPHNPPVFKRVLSELTKVPPRE